MVNIIVELDDNEKGYLSISRETIGQFRGNKLIIRPDDSRLRDIKIELLPTRAKNGIIYFNLTVEGKKISNLYHFTGDKYLISHKRNPIVIEGDESLPARLSSEDIEFHFGSYGPRGEFYTASQDLFVYVQGKSYKVRLLKDTNFLGVTTNESELLDFLDVKFHIHPQERKLPEEPQDWEARTRPISKSSNRKRLGPDAITIFFLTIILLSVCIAMAVSLC